MANGAYWFDNDTGNFVSSTYYFAELPGWVKDFNQSHPANKYVAGTWLNHSMPADPKQLYPALAASPFGNELIEAFAERALDAEQLGKRDVPDVLAVSFSSNDYVGHQLGRIHPKCAKCLSVPTSCWAAFSSCGPPGGDGKRAGRAHRRSRGGACAGSKHGAQNARRADSATNFHTRGRARP
jgi:hypothetical protein